MTTLPNAIDPARVEAFIGKAVCDLSANFTGVMIAVGHRLGLYAAMTDSGPQTPETLARATGIHPRYAAEWLSQQAAAGYVEYSAASGTFELPQEHALVLAHGQGPAFFPPAYDTIASLWHDEARTVQNFRDGEGIGWHEHHHRLFCGTEAFFKPGYQTQLTSAWIPAIEGMEARLKRGARVADVGCGHGASTIVMAKAYPESQFWGFDYHADSIATARERAAEAGVADRVHFEVASGQTFQGGPFDLICFMDCLHDMGDPVAAARHARTQLAPGGSLLLVEPRAADRLEDNLGPMGALFYAASAMLCVPHSHSEPGRLGLGAQAGSARLSAVVQQAGFAGLREVAEAPFNLVLEARS